MLRHIWENSPVLNQNISSINWMVLSCETSNVPRQKLSTFKAQALTEEGLWRVTLIFQLGSPLVLKFEAQESQRTIPICLVIVIKLQTLMIYQHHRQMQYVIRSLLPTTLFLLCKKQPTREISCQIMAITTLALVAAEEKDYSLITTAAMVLALNMAVVWSHQNTPAKMRNTTTLTSVTMRIMKSSQLLIIIPVMSPVLVSLRTFSTTMSRNPDPHMVTARKKWNFAKAFSVTGLACYGKCDKAMFHDKLITRGSKILEALGGTHQQF